MFGSSFYPLKEKVFDAIEKEGVPLREKYFPKKLRGKTGSFLTKGRVEDLYWKQKKSLQDIAKEYGCTKQWISLLMEKYGVKRRAASEALREAVMRNKITSLRRKI